MSGVPFRPGDAVGIVAPWFVAVIESERGGDLGNALIELSELPAGGVDELIEVVASLPLRSLPDFALGVVELHVVRVLVRGAMTARIQRDGGIEVVDGSDIRTWRELSIGRPSDVAIGVASELDLPAYYRTSGGVVPVSAVVVATVNDGLAIRLAPTFMPPVAQPSPTAVRVEEVVEVEVEAEGEVEGEVEIADLVVEVDNAVKMAAPPDEADEADADAAEDEIAAVSVSEHSDQTLLPADHWGAASPPAPVPAAVEPVAAGADEDDPYAELWMTKVRAVEDAAMRSGADGDAESDTPPPFVPPAAVPTGSGASANGAAAVVGADPIEEGDHDGHTRTVGSLSAAIAGAAGAPDHDADVSSGGVPSSPCINGHPNPPFAVTCRRCLAPVKETVERVARADAGVLVLPDGERIEVDRTIVVGRNPKADGLYTGDPPRLVGLSEQHDVSRTHVVIELSGWTAMVTDQDSMNGTEVQLPGKPPEQLRPHAPMAIVVGTKIVLANEVTLKLEGG